MTPDELREMLSGAGRGGVQKGLLVAMTKVALKLEAKAKQNATRSPRVRTGALRNSIAASVKAERTGVQISLRAGSAKLGRAPVRYARIQELGGIIRPKKSKYLAIPTDEVRTAGGVPQYRSPRDEPDLVFAQTKGLQPVLLSTTTGKVHWILKRQVKLRGRKYLWRAIRHTQRDVPDALRDVMAIALQAKLVASLEAGP